MCGKRKSKLGYIDGRRPRRGKRVANEMRCPPYPNRLKTGSRSHASSPAIQETLQPKLLPSGSRSARKRAVNHPSGRDVASTQSQGPRRVARRSSSFPRDTDSPAEIEARGRGPSALPRGLASSEQRRFAQPTRPRPPSPAASGYVRRSSFDSSYALD